MNDIVTRSDKGERLTHAEVDGNFSSIKAAIDRQSSLIINAADYGVVGDGETDNSSALLLIRDVLRLDLERLHTVEFPPGHYVYTNNRWLAHTGRVRVNGNGSTFQCIYSDPAGRVQNQRPFNMQAPDQNAYDEPFQGSVTGYTSGFKFATAAAGSRVVTLTEAGGLSAFAVGMRVLLWGYDQQWYGWPPNMRYYEWNVVSSVDEADNTITLANPMAHDYDDRWGDFVSTGSPPQAYYGAPRILSLERPGQYFYAHYIELNDLFVANNPNTVGGSLGLAVICEDLRMNNVRGDTEINVFPKYSRQSYYRDCVFRKNDIDKINGRVIFERCHLGMDLTHASGVQELRVVDCVIEGAVRACPRVLAVTGCRIRPESNRSFALQTHFNSWPVLRTTFVGNMIEPHGALEFVVDNHDAIAFTASRVDGNGFIRLSNTEGNRNNVLRPLIVGADLIRMDTAEAARITAIWYDGDEDEHVIEIAFATAFTDATVLRGYSMQQITSENNTIAGTPAREFRHVRPLQLSRRVVQWHDFTPPVGAALEPAVRTMDAMAYVHGVRVRVTRPYTGSDSSPYGLIYLISESGTVCPIRFSFLTVGRAEIGYSGTVATWDGVLDEIQIPDPTVLVRTVETRFRQGGLAISGSISQMPRFRIELLLEMP